tara:strand:- start:6224 stop:6454 length:231 start_codon:yes stop_codon:yes gene_type:complete
MDIGKAVKAILKAEDRSQRWLAERIGVSTQSLSKKLESGTRMRVDSLEEIATALGMKASKLLDLGCGYETTKKDKQ